MNPFKRNYWQTTQIWSISSLPNLSDTNIIQIIRIQFPYQRKENRIFRKLQNEKKTFKNARFFSAHHNLIEITQHSFDFSDRGRNISKAHSFTSRLINKPPYNTYITPHTASLLFLIIILVIYIGFFFLLHFLAVGLPGVAWSMGRDAVRCTVLGARTRYTMWPYTQVRGLAWQ